MKVFFVPCIQCAECGFYLSTNAVPGRVPDEPAILTATHPVGTCSSSGKIEVVEQRPRNLSFDPLRDPSRGF